MIFGPELAKGRTSGPVGREERAFARRSFGPLRFRSEPQIQHSKFKITDRDAACGGHADSATNCGPPPGGGCGPPIAARLIPCKSPQPSGRACDVEEQPSARGRLRAASRYATNLAGIHFLHHLLLLRAVDVSDVEFAAKRLSKDRRLRAASRYATDLAGAQILHHLLLRAADVSDVEFAAKHLCKTCCCGLPVALRPIFSAAPFHHN